MIKNRIKRVKVSQRMADQNPQAAAGVYASIPESLFTTLTADDLVLVADALGRSFRAGITFGERAVCEEGWVWDVAVDHGRELSARHYPDPMIED